MSQPLCLFNHALGKKLADFFRRHVVTVVKEPFRTFYDEPVHQILGNKIIRCRKEGEACFIMEFLGDQAGESRCFESLLEEELMDGLPAFLLGAGQMV